jgi:hypothetical protein
MSAMTSALLRLYPRAWRRRYGAEMDAMLAGERLTLRTLVDVLAGAIDARIKPQVRTTDQRPIQGVTTMTKTAACSPIGTTTADQWRSAAWMVGGSLVLTAIGILLKLRIGPNAFSEGLVYAAFPASLMLSSECTYLKRYSGAARMALSLGGAFLIILMMWASVAIANRI